MAKKRAKKRAGNGAAAQRRAAAGRPKLVTTPTLRPTDTAKHALWNRALLSIYHYGWKHKEALLGRPTPLNLIPLHRAVSLLIEGGDPEALPAVRLALGDLCRTRSSRPDPQVDREIGRLARAFSKWNHGPEWDHDHVVGQFLGIFQRDEKNRPILMHEKDAFAAAMGYMLDHTPSERKRPEFVTWAPTDWNIVQLKGTTS